MILTDTTPTKRRMLLAACAGDPQGPMTEAQKTALLRRLLDHGWTPTPEDTPVGFSVVEGWYDARQRQAQVDGLGR